MSPPALGGSAKVAPSSAALELEDASAAPAALTEAAAASTAVKPSEPVADVVSQPADHSKSFRVVRIHSHIHDVRRERTLHKCVTRLGLQYTSASQVVLQLPIFVICVLFIVSLNLKVKISALQTPVVLSALSSWTNCIFLTLPLVLMILHYSAARHARAVARSITKQAERKRQITSWNDDDIALAKQEGSRLGVTAVSLYVFVPLACLLAFVGAVFNAGSMSANGTRLAIIALGIILFYAIVVCSVHVFVRGLLRREKDNCHNYVTFSLEPTFLGLIVFQLFLTSFVILIQLTVPSSPGTNILLSAGTFSSEVFVYPSFDECIAHVNASYLDRYCQRSESLQLPWQQFGGGLNIMCDDGGWGVFNSLFSACRSLVAESVVKGPVGDNLFAQLYVSGLVLVKEYLASADPSLNIGNFMRQGSWYLRTAIVSGFLVAICVAPLAAHAFYVLTSQDSLAPWFAYLARLLGAFCLVLSLAMIFVHFLVRKFTAVNSTTFFISYKQDDQADGAVGMLYNFLPGKNHWLDKMMTDRSVTGMIKGVEACDVFLAVISPRYFRSWYCCLELRTAMLNKKPIQLVFNAHKTTVQSVLNILQQNPELSPLQGIEILPIHEEIQMIGPCVERITEQVRLEKVKPVFGQGDGLAPVPYQIGEHSFEDETAEKLAEKAKAMEAQDKEKRVSLAEAPPNAIAAAAAVLQSREARELLEDHESRMRAVEAKLKHLFTRTGAYEFQHNVNPFM